MKKRVKLLLFVIGLIFILNFVSSDFDVGKSDGVETGYGPLGNIKGWVNISLDDEPSNSLFEDSRGNSISLIELLKTSKNSGFKYNCTTADCGLEFTTSDSGSQEKSFFLNDGESKYLGFKFTGEIDSINSISFDFISDAPAYCSNQFEITFFEDNILTIGNNKSSSSSCPIFKSYGCFNQSKTTEESVIGEFPQKHCQKILFSASPGFNVGAWVNRGGDARTLTMALYNVNGNPIPEKVCNLPEGEGELFCGIDYPLLEPKELYLCIYSEDSGSASIRGYSENGGCGFYGISVESKAAFEMFAEGKKFDDAGTMTISNQLDSGNSLGEKARDYIEEKYGSLDCSDGCIVPFLVKSKYNQNIIINNVDSVYTKDYPTSTDKLYELVITPSIISSGFQKLYLDEGNFSVSNKIGNFSFKLNLDGEKVLEKSVFIEDVPIIKSLIPTLTAAAYPTNFEVLLNSSSLVTKYEWDFGDGNKKTTTTNKVLHTYNETGDYELKVTVTDSSSRYSYKIFEIKVDSPKEIIDIILTKKLNDLDTTKNQILKFDSFSQQELNTVLDTKNLGDQLSIIQKNYKKAPTEKDPEVEYIKIMTDLVKLEVPNSIEITRSANSFSFPPNSKKIDLDILKLIGKGDYESENSEKYKDAIVQWNVKNLDTKITFKEYSASYDGETKPVLLFFEMSVEPKEGMSPEDSYLILEKIEGFKFEDYYKEEEESEHYYFYLDEGIKIKFTTTEIIEFNDLPVFISPKLSDINIPSDDGENDEEEEETSKWVYFILIITFLILVGLGIYIFLQNWYKRKYEKHLFPNMNSLYNLIVYVQNQKKKGLHNDEIEEKLKDSGWNSEQVDYVLKKYAGKRTGMWEIPLDKALNIFKKTEEGKSFNSPPNQRVAPPRRVIFPNKRAPLGKNFHPEEGTQTKKFLGRDFPPR